MRDDDQLRWKTTLYDFFIKFSRSLRRFEKLLYSIMLGLHYNKMLYPWILERKTCWATILMRLHLQHTCVSLSDCHFVCRQNKHGTWVETTTAPINWDTPSEDTSALVLGVLCFVYVAYVCATRAAKELPLTPRDNNAQSVKFLWK